jgi:hypothetical protein
MEARALRQRQQINTLRRDVFAHLSGRHRKPRIAQFVEQLLVDQMHLPQIGRVAELRDARPMLDGLPGMRVALDAIPGS